VCNLFDNNNVDNENDTVDDAAVELTPFSLTCQGILIAIKKINASKNFNAVRKKLSYRH